MRIPFADRFKFLLERFLVRGAHYQLLAVAAVIGFVAVVAGLALRFGVSEMGTDESIWWAFLRLTDPGYLGDDQGALRRTISTVVTVLGYVLFMGSLVAIMTQWLHATMRRLEAGYTPVVRKNHVLVLGWTARTGIVIDDILRSEGRVRRFLRRRGARRLHIVLLAEEVGAALLQELKDRTDQRLDPHMITLRSGTPLRGDHLERVDFLRASVIIVPAGEFAREPDTADTQTIKTLLTISRHPAAEDAGELPHAVVELFDARKASIAASAYAGRLEVLASDAIVSRLIAQNVRHPGMSYVYTEIFTHTGENELHVRDAPEALTGASMADVIDSWPEAILLGLVRGRVPLLDSDTDVTIERGDKLVFLAREYAATGDDVRGSALPAQGAPAAVEAAPPEDARGREGRSLLLLGWSHRAPALIAELTRRASEAEITVVSAVAPQERASALAHYGAKRSLAHVDQLELDYTIPEELARVDPARFDHVVMLGSDWLDSGEESDARTIVGYLVLQDLLASAEPGPQVLVELLDPENVGLLGRDRDTEVLVSPVFVSHMLAQVALHPALRPMLSGLFTPGGAEIAFRPASRYGLTGARTSFADVRAAVRARGDVALGVRPAGAPPALNPPRDETYDLSGPAELVVLVTH